MKPGSKENGNFARRYPLAIKLADFIDDEARLTVFTARVHQAGRMR